MGNAKRDNKKSQSQKNNDFFLICIISYYFESKKFFTAIHNVCFKNLLFYFIHVY